MNAVILCAGFATRMYPLTRDFPKPLLDVAGKPVLDYVLEQVVKLPEIKNIHIVSNAKFFSHFKDWHRARNSAGFFGNRSVHLHNDGSVDNESRLGAAADLLFALKEMERPGRMLVSGGDNIFRFSLQPLWDRFLQGEHHLITALRESDPDKLKNTGVLQIDDNDRVVKFDEKPEHPQSNWISPPLYFFQPSVIATLEHFLESDGNHDAPGYFIRFLCSRETVKAAKVRYPRYDIGSLETYRQADCELRKNPELYRQAKMFEE